MATISAIRDGLKTRLDTIAGLNVYDTWPGQVVVPAAVVANGQTSYDVTMDGAEDFTCLITVLVQDAVDSSAQDALDAYRSPTGTGSVVAAVHADPTLGGVVDYSRVASAGPDRIIDYAGAQYLGCEFTVEIGD